MTNATDPKQQLTLDDANAEKTALATALATYRLSLENREEADLLVQTTLAKVRKLAKQATFQAEGKWYQIRSRNDRTYICDLKGPPKGRPKMSSEEKKANAIARAKAALVKAEVAVVTNIEP